MFPVFLVHRPYQFKTLFEEATVPYGIMCTPQISGKVQQLYREFPSHERWGDNGIFAGVALSPKQLLGWYQSLNLTHGLILDVFKEKEATLEFAEQMWKLYRQKCYTFELVGVAQGESPEDYADAVQDLVAIGFESIAIGGLLTIQSITQQHTIRRINDWLIREIWHLIRSLGLPRVHWLGALSPQRVLPGSADSKGWCMGWVAQSYSRSLSPNQARRRYLRETYFHQTQQLKLL